MRRRRFTLIELLVVVAIIGILASFLLPSLKKARDFANRADCINNMRTLGMWQQLFANDYDGRFCCGGQRSKPSNSSMGPELALGAVYFKNGNSVRSTYSNVNDRVNFKNVKVGHCKARGAIQQTSDTRRFFTSNVYLVGANWTTPPRVELDPEIVAGGWTFVLYGGMKRDKVKNPSQKILMWEAERTSAAMGGSSLTTPNIVELAPYTGYWGRAEGFGSSFGDKDGNIAFPHNDYCVMVYADGHADAKRRLDNKLWMVNNFGIDK